MGYHIRVLLEARVDHQHSWPGRITNIRTLAGLKEQLIYTIILAKNDVL